MALQRNQILAIKTLMRSKITNKLANYSRETSSMPFLANLMQDPEKVAAYSFIHSMATTLGMSVFEQTAKIIASSNYEIAETNYDVTGILSDEENIVISQIMQEIRNGTRVVNKEEEIKEILQCKSENGRKSKIRADLFLKNGNNEYYIEIKTAKPNIDVFNKSKQKLLEWVALRKKPVETILAIPYNPYYPEPYSRFTIQGVLDEDNELYVADKFWDFLGGEGTYIEILSVFNEIGEEFKERIQSKIKEVANNKMVI